MNASWCARIIGPGFWQDATGPLPVSHFQTRLHSSTDVVDNIIQNQPGADLVLADCSSFGPNGSGPEAKPVYRNHPVRFWPMLSSRSGPDANRIRHVYWVIIELSLMITESKPIMGGVLRDRVQDTWVLPSGAEVNRTGRKP